MEYLKAKEIADKTLAQLAPYCKRCEIAGSIRRKKPFVKDIEILVIEKQLDFCEPGIRTVVNKWERVKGKLPCKYTQRILPEGIKLDLFFVEEKNWGYHFAIRTGSAYFSHHVLAKGWVKKGYNGSDGYLTNKVGAIVPVWEEEDLFELIDIPYMEPEHRDENWERYFFREMEKEFYDSKGVNFRL